MTTAEDHKAAGNKALQAGKITEAIEEYTAAIRLDGSNHVYFSNRSAAYMKKGDAHNALEDAESCIGLSPDWAKGYSRKAAALHFLGRLNDSVAAYKEGLLKSPGDSGLTKGLAAVENEQCGPSPGTGRLFGPEIMAQMALSPKLRPFLNDPDVMTKIKLVQEQPHMTQAVLQDPKMMELFAAMMGAPPEEEANTQHEAKPSMKTEPKEEEVEEDLSQLSPAERSEREKKLSADAKKNEGNMLYKEKRFEEALARYDEAIFIDPTNMAFVSNKAAVMFTQKKYEDCISLCRHAVEVGKEHRASFEDRAKALSRAARAYQKLGKLAEAIETCQEAQLESFDKSTQRLLKTLELEKKKADALSYQDDAKAEAAKQRGNDYFRSQKWPEAVGEYEEAVKRAPKNAAIRNNLAAALCKILDFSGAQRQVEEALALDPKYVKAWGRKGDIEMYMKEFHKAMESYKKGLALDSENVACKEGLQKCMAQINYGRKTMTEAEKKEQAAHAMADPEVQAILQDPVTQQLLKDFGENPAAAQQAMRDPTVRAKIEKLIAAGIIETR